MSDKLNIIHERTNIVQNLLVNEYYNGVKFKSFPNLDTLLSSHYDRIYDTVVDYDITPRYFYETGLKIAFRDIFYYIDLLYENSPTNVIDVGCGECIWKKWFPGIVGFDPTTNEFSQQDFIDYFDQDFSSGHKDNWDNGMALNSIHFISWNQIENRICQAMNIVKHRFLFTFNFNVMQDVPKMTLQNLCQEFVNIIKRTEYNLVMFDAPVLRGIDKHKISSWSYINGTVRFILEK
jgi:hypothetical protein